MVSSDRLLQHIGSRMGSIDARVGFIRAELTETQSSREEYDGRLVQVVAICRKNSESSEDRAAARRFLVVVEQHSLKQEKKILRSPRRTTAEEKTIKLCNKKREVERSSGLMQHFMTIRPLLTTNNLLNPRY
jgi:hypothetical protein